MSRHLAFVINLIQDVAISRPLVQLARDKVGCDILLIVTSAFKARDPAGIWAAELKAMTAEFGARVVEVGTPHDATLHMQGHSGMIFAASESQLLNHRIVSDILRCAPRGFLRVTLQHGLECIGFAHNQAHDRAHGCRVGFAADIVVGWSDPELLYSMRADQRSKLYVAGPPQMIHDQGQREARTAQRWRPALGLVCENLHSVRVEEQWRGSFIDIFEEFVTAAHSAGGKLELRPHPGGRFTDKNKVPLPKGVVANVKPLFRQDLTRFDFAFSAPSTILLDLMLADVPVAVWQNAEDSMDLSNLAGLPVVRSAEDWWRFASEALESSIEIIARQRAFLSRLAFPTDVANRYEALLSAAA